MTTHDTEALVARLKKRADRWQGNDDGAFVSIKLGDLRHALAALAALAQRPAGAGVTVKPLEWHEYKAFGNLIKTVAHDCFGNEFARFDLRFSQIPQAKIDEVQTDFERHILAALSGAEAPAQGWRELPNDEATHDYVLQYGGRCRDCADNFGVCESRGMPCDPKAARKAVRRVIGALNYGHRNGFLPAAPQQEGR